MKFNLNYYIVDFYLWLCDMTYKGGKTLRMTINQERFTLQIEGGGRLESLPQQTAEAQTIPS